MWNFLNLKPKIHYLGTFALESSKTYIAFLASAHLNLSIWKILEIFTNKEAQICPTEKCSKKKKEMVDFGIKNVSLTIFDLKNFKKTTVTFEISNLKLV